MRTPPLRIRLVVATVVTLALIAFTCAAVLEPRQLAPHHGVLLAVLGGMLLVARRSPMPLAANQHLMVGAAPMFAATLLIPAPLALPAAAAAVLIADRSRRASWLQAAFNSATGVLQVAVGAAVFAVATSSVPPAELRSDVLALAAFLAALSMYAVNVALVEAIVAVQHRRFCVGAALRRRRLDLLPEGGLYSLGLLIAMLAVVHLWAVLLLAVPALVVYRSLRDSLSLQARLTHRASHDDLTDLANRALFTESTGQALARAARTQGAISVLFLDMDGFKRINDTLGHGVGDDVLRALGRRLVESAGPGATVARLGGDEFIVLLDDATPADAIDAAERLLGVLRIPVNVAGQHLAVDASIGVVHSTGGRDSVEDLLRRADIAMYRAKALGKGRIAVFAPEMQAAVQERVALEQELRHALEQGHFSVHYQPTIDLATGRIAGSEALVRWQHPEQGPIPPGRFIGLAEETGLIVPLGRWILREACRQNRRWQTDAPNEPPLSVSVNLSARQIQEPGIVAEVAAVLAETGLAPASLVLEITESAMMQDTDDALHTLQALKALGVRLALDDFGTGYSSLSYLHRFPFDILKIDRSFVEGLDRESVSGCLAGTIVRMGQSLGLSIVAEGIEHAEQADALRLLDCDYGQGYYFARPLPPEAMTALLRAPVQPGGPVAVTPGDMQRQRRAS
jgi:diguanylate cyclase (GGDEF)-like protein